MDSRAQHLTCVCILKFWVFFPWAPATLFKSPLYGHKGELVSSLKGEGLFMGNGLGEIWASYANNGKPKTGALIITFLPFTKDPWELREYTIEEGVGLKVLVELVWFDRAIECACFRPSHAWLATTGIWTPMTSFNLSSSDPPQLATLWFSKTSIKPILFLVQPPKYLRQSISPRPRTPQIKQKRRSHSIWNPDLKLT